MVISEHVSGCPFYRKPSSGRALSSRLLLTCVWIGLTSVTPRAEINCLWVPVTSFSLENENRIPRVLWIIPWSAARVGDGAGGRGNHWRMSETRGLGRAPPSVKSSGSPLGALSHARALAPSCKLPASLNGQSLKSHCASPCKKVTAATRTQTSTARPSSAFFLHLSSPCMVSPPLLLAGLFLPSGTQS